jgi:hypothetical protein
LTSNIQKQAQNSVSDTDGDSIVSEQQIKDNTPLSEVKDTVIEEGHNIDNDDINDRFENELKEMYGLTLNSKSSNAGTRIFGKATSQHSILANKNRDLSSKLKYLKLLHYGKMPKTKYMRKYVYSENEPIPYFTEKIPESITVFRHDLELYKDTISQSNRHADLTMLYALAFKYNQLSRQESLEKANEHYEASIQAKKSLYNLTLKPFLAYLKEEPIDAEKYYSGLIDTYGEHRMIHLRAATYYYYLGDYEKYVGFCVIALINIQDNTEFNEYYMNYFIPNIVCDDKLNKYIDSRLLSDILSLYPKVAQNIKLR